MVRKVGEEVQRDGGGEREGNESEYVADAGVGKRGGVNLKDRVEQVDSSSCDDSVLE